MTDLLLISLRAYKQIVLESCKKDWCVLAVSLTTKLFKHFYFHYPRKGFLNKKPRLQKLILRPTNPDLDVMSSPLTGTFNVTASAKNKTKQKYSLLVMAHLRAVFSQQKLQKTVKLARADISNETLQVCLPVSTIFSS